MLEMFLIFVLLLPLAGLLMIGEAATWLLKKGIKHAEKSFDRIPSVDA